MATRYGQAAIDYWKRLKTKRATQKKTLFTIIGIVIVIAVLINKFQ